VTVSTKHASNRGWLAVDLPSLLANARAVRDAARGARLLPVIKANAYGLGAIPVARALERLDPWGFAVATLEEAVALRDAGIGRPILVLTPAMAGQQDDYANHGLRAVLGDPGVAAAWTAPFHLEVDTGMGRCGVRWDDGDTLRRLRLPTLEGAFTHFYAADENPASVGLQWSRFREALACLGTRPPLLHAANSAAAWRLDEKLDLVRPGIFLYGGEPVPDLPAALPVATVRAPVVSVRRVRAGDTVSYGGAWTAPADTTVATLGIGYADGVPRLVEGKAQVLMRGERLSMVGRVTMDFIMVDAGPAGGAVRVGDVATVVGRDGDGEISLHEFARWSETISYEVLTRFGARLSRVYVDG
jgi:alanine racemase